MELVSQLWAYKSDRFLLGIRCPEILKNHVWLVLIVAKTAIVGLSMAHLSQPQMFSDFLIYLDTSATGPVAMETAAAGQATKLRFRPVVSCKSDDTLHQQLIRYFYWQGATLLFLFITYIRVLLSGVSLTSN